MASGCQSERSGRAADPPTDCANVARHALELMPADMQSVDEKELADMCERETTPEERRCVMSATTLEEFRRCGPEGASAGALSDVAQGTPAPERPPPASPPPVDPTLVRQAGAALRTAVAPCAIGSVAIPFKYTLVVEKGEGRADDVKLEGADVQPATRDCLARAMAAARWKVSSADARVEVRDGFGDAAGGAR
ncbi:MAG TPA: hypothetical protein VIG06_10435 [Kofleriaceae bacterium]